MAGWTGSRAQVTEAGTGSSACDEVHDLPESSSFRGVMLQVLEQGPGFSRHERAHQDIAIANAKPMMMTSSRTLR